jgi:hypothetical protein
MKKWMTRSALAGSALLLVTRAYTYATGPLANRTGAPGEQTCNAAGCHPGNPLNAPDAAGHAAGSPGGPGVFITGVPDSYVPGATYPITIQVMRAGQSRWGFELTVKKADKSRGGELAVTDPDHTQLIDSDFPRPTATTPQYMEHTLNGTFEGQKDAGPKLSFNWTAPAAGSGTVTFYAAGNAANGNGVNTGDFIYTTSVASQEGSAAPPVVYGDLNGDGRVNVQDATLALRMAVGLTPPTDSQTQAGDVAPVPGSGPRAGQPFGDGKVNVSDATRILRRAVGLDTQFP